MPWNSKPAYTVIPDKCRVCGVERMVQPSRAGRTCVLCRNRSISQSRIVPKREWEMTCRYCQREVSTKRKQRPDSIACRKCICARAAAASIGKRARGICGFLGCHKPSHAKGLCHTHYEYGRRKSDPLFNAKRRAYTSDNKESIRVYTLSRKIGKARSLPEDRENLKHFYRHLKSEMPIPCFWCGKDTIKGDRHGDHIIPLSRGGPHTTDNLCCSCVKCNTSRGGKMPEEFHAMDARKREEVY